jgi:CheY-like chemotaxis protein
VAKSKGTISIDSDPARGTRVTVLLPRASIDSEAPPPEPMPARRILSILVAEDEPTLRERICHSLEKHGHRVLSASDGQDALELAQGESFDLLVSDILMRRVDGPELATKLRSKRAGLPVLFITGYGDEVASPSASANTLLLRKPFSSDDLLAKISELIGE